MLDHIDGLQELGLAKNEARIFETLTKEGELSPSEIASLSGVNRRNVYDSLNRLIEKGLAFEVLEGKENHYEAVHPDKLMEMVKTKEELLKGMLPGLIGLYDQQTPHEAVYIYRGLEGHKNVMRDILRTKEDVYTIGAKGGWVTPEIKNFTTQFRKEAVEKGITYHLLFDYDVKKNFPDVLEIFKKRCVRRFLPKEYFSNVTIDIYGNRSAIFSGLKIGGIDKDISFTVIVNKQIADAFRVWFKALWKISSK